MESNKQHLQYMNFFKELKHNKMLLDRHKRRSDMDRTGLQQLMQVLMSMAIPRRQHSLWSLNRTNFSFWEYRVHRYGEKQFKEDFRMSSQSFKWLVSAVSRISNRITRYYAALSLEKITAVAMYALGSSTDYRKVAQIFGIGITIVDAIVKDFCLAIYAFFEDDFMKFYPPTREQIENNVEGFQYNWGFPQTFGAIDACHIEVSPPGDNAFEYYNSNGWYSMILLAVVDHHCRFMYLDIDLPRSDNKSPVFQKSFLKKKLVLNPAFCVKLKIMLGQRVPVFLIGDSRFPLAYNLIKPYPSTQRTQPKKILFNKKLSHAKSVAGNAFQQLKARFPRVGMGYHMNYSDGPFFIRACCILHNILSVRNDGVNEAWLEEVRKRDEQRVQPEFESDDTDKDGIYVRTAVTEFLAIKEFFRSVNS